MAIWCFAESHAGPSTYGCGPDCSACRETCDPRYLVPWSEDRTPTQDDYEWVTSLLPRATPVDSFWTEVVEPLRFTTTVSSTFASGQPEVDLGQLGLEVEEDAEDFS